eukprot:1877961-Amphidinium_carterae.1
MLSKCSEIKNTHDAIFSPPKMISLEHKRYFNQSLWETGFRTSCYSSGWWNSKSRCVVLQPVQSSKTR